MVTGSSIESSQRSLTQEVQGLVTVHAYGQSTANALPITIQPACVGGGMSGLCAVAARLPTAHVRVVVR